MSTRATRVSPLLPARILTEVEHRWDEAPPDDELSALEQLLEPLLGLFAQFGHVFSIPNYNGAGVLAKDTGRGSDAGPSATDCHRAAMPCDCKSVATKFERKRVKIKVG